MLTCDVHSCLSRAVQIVQMTVRQMLVEALCCGQRQCLASCVSGTHAAALTLRDILQCSAQPPVTSWMAPHIPKCAACVDQGESRQELVIFTNAKIASWCSLDHRTAHVIL